MHNRKESIKSLQFFRHLIGANDDILDLALLPSFSSSSSSSSYDQKEEEEEDDDDYISAEKDKTQKDATATASSNEKDDGSNVKFRVAVVTNSNEVRIMNEGFSCRSLNGHTDIVLSVDASPDG